MKWNEVTRTPRQDAQVVIWNEGDQMVTRPVMAEYTGEEFRIRGPGCYMPIKITHWAYVDFNVEDENEPQL